MNPDVYIHDLDPYLIHIAGGGIAWYGLSYLVGFALAYWLFRRLAARKRILLTDAGQVSDFMFYCVLGTLLGGRIGYGLLYSPDLFGFSNSFPWWDFLAIHHGGMASHGAMVGLVLGAILFARKNKLPALHLCDLMSLAAPLGIFFGRIANFINGELYGRPAPAGLPWAVKFPQEMFNWTGEKLDSLRNALANIGLHADSPDELIVHAIEQVRDGNARVIGALEPLLTARHPSQLYAALLEGLLLFVLLAAIWRNPRKPGVLTAWFLLLYGAVRIFDELFRTPDAQLGFRALGMTRGQWLSAAMIALGVVCLVICSRKAAAKIGGWRAPPPAASA